MIIGNRTALIASTVFIFGCSYQPPVQTAAIQNFRTIDRPVDKVWDDALGILVLQGYPIILNDKSSGVITTGKKLVKLNETQADCGAILGFPFLKDKRAVTSASYSIRITQMGSKSEVRVNSQIEGNFISHAGATNQHLNCASLGFLETELLNKITAPP